MLGKNQTGKNSVKIIEEAAGYLTKLLLKYSSEEVHRNQ